MRWVEFTQVMLSEEGGQLKMASTPRILQAESVYSVVPAAIPSDVAGPTGGPIGKPAAALFVAGEQILVNCTVSEALYKLTWEGIKIEGPEGVGEDEYFVTQIIKRPEPNGGSLNQSNLIL